MKYPNASSVFGSRPKKLMQKNWASSPVRQRAFGDFRCSMRLILASSVQTEIEKRKRVLAERRIDLKNARTMLEEELVSEVENASLISEEK